MYIQCRGSIYHVGKVSNTSSGKYIQSNRERKAYTRRGTDGILYNGKYILLGKKLYHEVIIYTIRRRIDYHGRYIP